VSEWVSVNDRLPDKEGKYLCAEYSKQFNKHSIKVFNFAFNLYKVDKYDFSNCKGISGFYEYDAEWGYSYFRNVTHWMPLPELPMLKGGADNG
jgi:hypothetical protein